MNWAGWHLVGAAAISFLAYRAAAAVAGAVAKIAAGCVAWISCKNQAVQTAGQVVDTVTLGVYRQIGGKFGELASSPGWKLTYENASRYGKNGTNIVVRIAERSTRTLYPYVKVDIESKDSLNVMGNIIDGNLPAAHLPINMVNPAETIDLIIRLVQGAK